MKKSLIWILTVVMAITFGALLYFQIMYLENMVKMREEQFSEGVMRSLNATSDFLDRQETLHFLEEDVNIIESSFYDGMSDSNSVDADLKYSVASPDGTVTKYTLKSEVEKGSDNMGFPSPTSTIGDRYGSMQEVIRSQYLYQKGLLTEVILSILRDSGSRPIMERADSTVIRNCLSTELANNGLNVPFVFSVSSQSGREIYATDGFNPEDEDKYVIPLFSNTDVSYRLNVEFPTKHSYIFSSVRFIIPSLAFSVILLIVFVFTVILAFRQKKLTEMKSDFVNNMTHELKTPIATISLAAQMLGDASVRKSPDSIKHLSEVISEESKRLRFQVEKVLHLSVIDNAESTLKFTEVNANETIENVVNTFKLKVERQGGTLEADLDAIDSDIYVDQLQFTNVIHNLLENALKYSREDVEPQLVVSTADLDGSQLEIRVKDNGIGIHREDLKRIFDKFYRVSTGNRHDVKGFGLGLAYVKKMITAFRGNIHVESEPGVGSTFIIRLPLAESEAKSK